MYRWGLVPFWAKDHAMGYKMINARSETVREKSSYKGPFRKSRCLVLADGFYEWKKVVKQKQPYRITLEPERRFYFAGLYSFWKTPEGYTLPTFTILTTSANELVAPIHDRMPLILQDQEVADWMNPQTEEADLLNMLRPYPAEEMVAYPVHPAVGNPRNDTPELIEVYTS